jgi:hypothetical protein
MQIYVQAAEGATHRCRSLIPRRILTHSTKYSIHDVDTFDLHRGEVCKLFEDIIQSDTYHLSINTIR